MNAIAAIAKVVLSFIIASLVVLLGIGLLICVWRRTTLTGLFCAQFFMQSMCHVAIMGFPRV
ncbi:MAG: hypothetical protein H7Y43_18090 [Akkermansiaceae bacterium]|nr:hypothetical protein [Verrucomicrobiales bacterium]